MNDAADLVIAGGRIVSAERVVAADVAVRDGRIDAVGPPETMPPARERSDARGLHVLPGAIDVHVHIREPGFSHKETWTSATRAAAVGGVTTVFDMPNTNPSTATPESVAAKLALAAPQALVDFGVYGLIGPHNLDALPAMRAAGAVSFKLYMGGGNPLTPCPDDGAIVDAFAAIAEMGLRVSVHAENAAILARRGAALRAAGRNDAAAHLAAHPDVAAVEAVSRAAIFAEWTGCAIHFVHENTRHALPHLAFAKERGVDVTVETCPHYLLLSADDAGRLGGGFIRVKPPIREPGHAEALWGALGDGLIDMISTDHAPHLPEEKRRPSVWDCAPGFPGVETSLPLMLSAVNDGRLTLPDVVRLMSAAPARAFGLKGKGAVAPGMDADLALVDMAAAPRAITAAGLHSIGAATPFEGVILTARPVRTLVRGRTVALDGAPLDAHGWGRPVEVVPRSKASAA